MARAKKDPTLDNRTNRLKLLPRRPPFWTALAEGEHFGYYRPESRAAGTWQAKWRDKATGERKATAIGTSDDYEDADGVRILDWAQAQAKARKWYEEVARQSRRRADGEDTHEGAYTIKVAMEHYTQDCLRRGVKSVDRQVYQINAHILPALGEIDVARITRRQIERWLDALATSPRRLRTKAPLPPGKPTPKPRNFKKPRKAAKVAPQPSVPPSTENEKRARKDSANRVLTILKAALNHAHDRRMVGAESPWKEVKPYRGTTSARVRFLSIEDQVRFVRACPPDFQMLVKAALYTGAPYGELTRITVAEYNREAQTLFIPSQISKSGKARHIFLTEEGQRFFEATTAGLKADALMFERAGEVKRRVSKAGQTWGRNDQARAMAAACEAAAIALFTFHELRHTAASTWIGAGLDLILVARQLGHSDTRMVEKHYGHLCPDAAAARFRSIAPALGLEGPEQVASLQIKPSQPAAISKSKASG